jgi:hypothetical protein
VEKVIPGIGKKFKWKKLNQLIPHMTLKHLVRSLCTYGTEDSLFEWLHTYSKDNTDHVFKPA